MISFLSFITAVIARFCCIFIILIEEGEWWKRSCKTMAEHPVGCERHSLDDGDVIDECICDIDLCNKDMGPATDTTTPITSSTTEGILMH